MNLFQRYLFRQALWPFLTAIAALAALALLTQSLSNIGLIAERGETAAIFIYITMLAVPQLVALLLPIAVFIACIAAFNRLTNDSELTVGAAAGMSRAQRLSPFMRLAIYACFINLAVNLFVQPAAFRELRRALYDIRTDVAASFMRPGEFTALGGDVTFFARDVSDAGVMTDVFIQDGEGPLAVVYAARQGLISEASRGPVMQLEDGVVSQLDADGEISSLTFERYEFELSAFLDPTAVFFFKESDKYLPELLSPTAGDIARSRDAEALFAEGHYRLSSPLYAITFALIAAAAFFSGDHRRTGYGRAVLIAGGAALGLRLAGFGAQAAAANDAALNFVQYAIPVGGGLVAIILLWRPGRWRVIPDNPAGGDNASDPAPVLRLAAARAAE